MRAFMQAFNTQRLLAQMLVYSFLFFVRSSGKFVSYSSSRVINIIMNASKRRAEDTRMARS